MVFYSLGFIFICTYAEDAQKPEEGIQSLGVGVIESCEPPNIGAGNQMCVSCKGMCKGGACPAPQNKLFLKEPRK